MKPCITIGFNKPRNLNTQVKTRWNASWYILVFCFFSIVLNFVAIWFCFMVGDLICAYLKTKWSCSNKLFNFEKSLSQVMVGKLVLGSLVIYPFFSYGICLLQTLICFLLSLVFLTNQGVTGCWMMHWIQPYPWMLN